MRGERDVEPFAPQGLEVFCRKEWPRLVGLLVLLTGDRDVAQELAQETLVRVCRDAARVLSMDAPGPWAHRVAVNLANSHLRRLRSWRNARSRMALERAPVGDPEPADAIAVRAALASLSQRQRSAIVLRYYDDLPVREIAAALSCPEGTVKTLLHDSIAVLRRQGLIGSEFEEGVSNGT